MDGFKLFFSHRSIDSWRVSELQAALRELLPNLPFHDVSAGVPYSDDWQVPAAAILESCDGLVCVIGADTHESEAVDWEIREAYRLGKPLIVTRLSTTYALPPSCNDLQIEAHDWNANGVAGRIGELLVPRALFLNHDWASGKPEAQGLWNQYNLMVQSWESLISRRQTVNTVYVTANAALLAGIGVLISSADKTGPLWGATGVSLLAFLGTALSLNWRRTVMSYGTLSRAKSRIVTALEAYMPAQLFDAEWRVLEAHRYKSTTDADRQTASFFMLLFASISLVAAGISIGQLF